MGGGIAPGMSWTCTCTTYMHVSLITFTPMMPCPSQKFDDRKATGEMMSCDVTRIYWYLKRKYKLLLLAMLTVVKCIQKRSDICSTRHAVTDFWKQTQQGKKRAIGNTAERLM